jgi:FMN-dependent NADH-azoreductase
MPNLLVIQVSPRFDYSVSRKLTNKFVEDGSPPTQVAMLSFATS